MFPTTYGNSGSMTGYAFRLFLSWQFPQPFVGVGMGAKVELKKKFFAGSDDFVDKRIVGK
jgi:hypothetical protein